jgi:hypothetical protein
LLGSTWLAAAMLAAACSQAGGPVIETFPAVQDGWAVWRAPDPVLINVAGGDLKVLMQCKAATWRVQVRDIAPAQAFPQPEMTVRMNGAEWTAVPVAEMRGPQPSLTAEYYIFRSPQPSTSVLSAFKANTPTVVAFNGSETAFSPIPPSMGEAFAEFCESAWMR